MIISKTENNIKKELKVVQYNTFICIYYIELNNKVPMYTFRVRGLSAILVAMLFLFSSCQLNEKKQPNEVVLEVAPFKVEGDAGAFRGEFYWVKEDGGNWGIFYNRIEGFEFEDGYEYVLKVRKDTVLNPPADASSLKYTLIQEVFKKKEENKRIDDYKK